MNSTPSRWTQEIVDLYESGAASQFIVCGNIHDRYLISTQGKSRLSSLTDYIKEALLTKFDVILRYDLGNALAIRRYESQR